MGTVHCWRTMPYSLGMSDPASTPRKSRAYSKRIQTGPHANNIGLLRERAGLTQAQAIEATGLSESYFKQLEYGHKPLTAPVIIALCSVLACQPEDLTPPGHDERLEEEMLVARFRLLDPEGRAVLLAAARRFAST